MKLTGLSGRLEAGGRLAATLGRYEYDGGSAAFEVKAGCSQVDEFWLEAGGLTLALRVGAQEWLWTGVTAWCDVDQIVITGHGKPYRQELIDG